MTSRNTTPDSSTTMLKTRPMSLVKVMSPKPSVRHHHQRPVEAGDPRVLLVLDVQLDDVEQHGEHRSRARRGIPGTWPARAGCRAPRDRWSGRPAGSTGTSSGVVTVEGVAYRVVVHDGRRRPGKGPDCVVLRLVLRLGSPPAARMAPLGDLGPAGGERSETPHVPEAYLVDSVPLVAAEGRDGVTPRA